MLFKIAFRNFKRQIGGYFVYFVTVALTVSILFSLNGIVFGKTVNDLAKDFFVQVKVTSAFLSVILGCAVAAVLGYGCAFLVRRRKKEFGMYLTLGMSRSNILALFTTELFFAFVFSLAAGIGLGMLVYQGIFAGFTQFYRGEAVSGDYSAFGFIATVLEVGIMFLLSSAFSLIYLKRVSPAKLLQGRTANKRTTKRPGAWLKATFAFAAVLVVSLLVVAINVGDTSKGAYAGIVVGGASAAFISIVLIYIGAMKSAVPYLLENKKFSARGTRTFTLRQLSGRLSVDSVFFGLIAVLLSIAIVGGNLFFTILGAQVAVSHNDNPFTVVISSPCDADGELTGDVPEWLESFGTVCSVRGYSVYELPSRQVSPYFDPPMANNDYVICESDYIALAAMTGETVQPIGDGVAIIGNGSSADDLKKIRSTDYSGFTFEIGEYSLPVSYVSPVMYTIVRCAARKLVTVVPDDVFAEIAGDSALYTAASTHYAVDYENGEFDENGLRAFFSAKNREDSYREATENSQYYSDYFNIDVSGVFLDTLMQMASPWLLIIFFVTVVFALSSLAMLGLKSVSAVAEDKRRYRLLYLAGATEKESLRSLTVQLALYFLLPFVLPILINIPVSFICMVQSKLLGGYMPNLQIIGFAAMFSGILLALFGIYCAVICIIARKEIRRALHGKD